MNEINKVLIIEDDPEISQLLERILKKIAVSTVVAYSGTEGLLQLEKQNFAVVLLDLMLPGLRGEALIKKIREQSTTPIIVISAKIDIEDKVYALKIGADDYITKPFHQAEVLARVEVQLRKATYHQQKVAVSHEKIWREIVINTEKLTAKLDSQSLTLTNSEFDILNLLVTYPEHAFSKKEIYEKVWKGTYVGDDNTISVHVSNLRKKIAEITPEEYIKTIWGIGFMMV